MSYSSQDSQIVTIDLTHPNIQPVDLWVDCAAISPSGLYCIQAGHYPDTDVVMSALYQWDDTRRCFVVTDLTLPGDVEHAICCDFSPNSQLLAVAHGRKVMVYNTTRKAVLKQINVTCNNVCFSPCGKYFACSTYRQGIWRIDIFDPINWILLRSIPVAQDLGYPTQCVFNRSSNPAQLSFFVGTSTGQLLQYNLQGQIVGTFTDPQNPVNDSVVSCDVNSTGSVLVTAFDSSEKLCTTVKLWNISTKTVIHTIQGYDVPFSQIQCAFGGPKNPNLLAISYTALEPGMHMPGAVIKIFDYRCPTDQFSPLQEMPLTIAGESQPVIRAMSVCRAQESSVVPWILFASADRLSVQSINSDISLKLKNGEARGFPSILTLILASKKLCEQRKAPNLPLELWFMIFEDYLQYS